MKKQTIINSIIASGLLFTGAVSASTQDSETDLIYGVGNVVASQSEAYVAGSSLRNNLASDLIYGEQKSVPSRGEAPDRFADNRDSNTDIVYGS